MTIRNRRAVLSFVVVILLIGFVQVAVSEITPAANPVFIHASVLLSTDMYSEFDAAVQMNCPTISVTSCTLQKLVSGQWNSVGSIPPPSHIATNTSWFAASANYSSYCTKGQTYRIKAVFSAGGESVTRYSSGATYQ